MVQVRQHLAEGEAGLVLVEHAREHQRHHVGGGQRHLAAGLGDQRAPRGVVGDQLVDAPVQGSVYVRRSKLPRLARFPGGASVCWLARARQPGRVVVSNSCRISD